VPEKIENWEFLQKNGDKYEKCGAALHRTPFEQMSLLECEM
jgi:hypothetical protein